MFIAGRIISCKFSLAPGFSPVSWRIAYPLAALAAYRDLSIEKTVKTDGHATHQIGVQVGQYRRTQESAAGGIGVLNGINLDFLAFECGMRRDDGKTVVHKLESLG